MRFFSPLVTGSAAICLLLAGCSGGNSTVDATGMGGSGTGSSTSAAGIGGASAAAIQAYCDATAGPFCEALFNCCTDPTSLTYYGGTVENCKRRYRYDGGACLWGATRSYEAWLEAGTTVFDQARLDACVARLKSMAAGGAACVQSAAHLFEWVCSAAFQGQIAPGEPCFVSSSFLSLAVQCKHGSCHHDTLTCRPFAQLWEPCLFVVDVAGCDPELQAYCQPYPYPNGPYVCVPQGEIGDPCHSHPLECKSRNCDTTNGKCVLADPMTMGCWSQ